MGEDITIAVGESPLIPHDIHFIRYFLQLKSNKSLSTASAYEKDIKDFFKKDIEAITIGDVRNVSIFDTQQFILDLTSSGISSSTISRKISALSSLYNWMLKYQDNKTGYRVLQFNPFANLKEEKPTINNRETSFLSHNEAVMLLDCINTSTIIGLRNKAIIALALTTALRKSEITNIKLSDITTYDGYDVIKVIRKGNKQDMVKLQAPVRNLIEQYILNTGRNEEDNTKEYLFIGHSSNGLNGQKLNKSALNYVIDRLARRAGIKNKHLCVHSTRHTAITLAISAGASVEKVRDFAFHKNLSTTNRYIHSIDKIKNNAGDFIKVI
jgi:site-specific recombinase XerD